jgi:hypothetical protein
MKATPANVDEKIPWLGRFKTGRVTRRQQSDRDKGDTSPLHPRARRPALTQGHCSRS